MQTPEGWREIQDLFERVRNLPADERDRVVNAATNPVVRTEVQRLLCRADEDLTPAAALSRSHADRPVAGPLAAGCHLGPYRVEACLARGAGSVVYRCQNPSGAIVVARVFEAGSGVHPDRCDQLRQMIARLDQPAIVSPIDTGECEAGPFMVMEHVEGERLTAHVRGLDLVGVLLMFERICAPLAHAHEAGLIHGALKPANVLVSPAGDIRVLDLGVAHLVQVRPAGAKARVDGSFAYAAPEQVAGETPTPQTDIHALGVMLFEVLTGQLPWGDPLFLSDSEQIEAILHRAPPLASRAASETGSPPIAAALICGELDRVVAGCLAKIPAMRYASARHLAADLRRFRQGDPIQGAPEPHADAREQVRGERRVLTVMFVDLVGSSQHSDRLDPEDYEEQVSGFHAAVSRRVSEFGGHIAQFLGDGVLVYFGYPTAREDDAQRALLCGLRVLEAVDGMRFEPRPQVRIGVHVGEVAFGVDAPGQQGRLAFGAVVNQAARIQALADPQTLVVSGAVVRLVPRRFVTEPMGERRLRGFGRPIALYRVIAANRHSMAPAGEVFVGRARPLAGLQACWKAVVSGRGQTVLIGGEAGVGKSRLIGEFRSSLNRDRVTWLQMGCAELSRDMVLAPVIELIDRQLALSDEIMPLRRQRLLELLDGDREALELVGPLLQVEPDGCGRSVRYGPELRRDKRLDALRDWIARQCVDHPVVLAVEDLHWADPTTLSLLERLLPVTQAHRLLLICTHRPEHVFAWHETGPVTTLTLQPLGHEDAAELLRKLLGSPLRAELSEAILERANGLPLFIEEIVRDLQESDRREDEPARANELYRYGDVPATLHAALAARIDRLGDARTLLQVCAVVGRDIRATLLARLLADPPPVVEQQLRSLQYAGFLVAGEGVAGSALHFRHALVRDAAYASMLKKSRRVLHGLVADMLASESPIRAPGLVAEHFERAGNAESALRWWHRAGDEAHDGYANEEAITAYRRALEMSPDPVLRLQLVLRLGETLGRIGLAGEAERLLREAMRMPQAASRQWQGRLLLRVGLVHFEAGDFPHALQVLCNAQQVLPRPCARSPAEAWSDFLCLQLRLRRLEYFLQRAGLERELDLIEADVKHYGSAAHRVDWLNLRTSACVISNGMRADDERTALCAEAVQIADRECELEIRTNAYFSAGITHLWRDELEPAGVMLTRANQMAEQTGRVLTRLHCRTYLGMLSRRLGKVDDTDELAQSALALARQVEQPTYISLAEAAGAWVAWRRDDPALAMTRIEDMFAQFERMPRPNPFRWTGVLPWAAISLALGDVTEVVPELLKLLEPSQHRLPGPLTEALLALSRRPAVAAVQRVVDRAGDCGYL